MDGTTCMVLRLFRGAGAKVERVIVGVLKETKTDEYRVALLPVGARAPGQRRASGADRDRGPARAADSPTRPTKASERSSWTGPIRSFAAAQLIVKVKEPQAAEIAQLEPRHTVFGYMHFAGSRELTEGCLRAGFTALAYETLRALDGSLPLLDPDERGGGAAVDPVRRQISSSPCSGGACCSVACPASSPANVLVLGGGVVGSNAARVAAGMGADVVIMDVNLATLRALDMRDAAQCHDHLRRSARDRRLSGASRSGHRRRAATGSRRAEARQPAPALADEARQRHRRRLDRPGRLLRDVAPDHAQPTRRSSSTVSCTIAWPTCPPRWVAPARARCATRRCRTCDASRSSALPIS